ncbi:MAG: hypothetical protein QG597_210, partial [Actinomycetota bacterium]|nr:hypothetical protein [Actinomycetota bacterium]
MGRYLQDPTTGRLNGAIGEGRDGAPRPLPATSCAPAGDQPAGSLTGALTTVTATRRRTQAQALAWMARYQSWAFGRQPGAAVSADAYGTLWVSDTF